MHLFLRRLPLVWSTLVAAALLSACGGHASGPASTAVPAVSPAATVLSPELQAVYNRSCKNCHAVPASGAPQVGDARAWAPRIAQGADILLEHVFNGYNSMPPLGSCMDCNEKQFRALIGYLSGATLEK